MSGDELEACSSEIATVANANQSSPFTTAGNVETMLEAEDFCTGGIKECTLQNEDASFPVENAERMHGTVVDYKIKCIIRDAVLGAMKIQSEFSSSRAHFLRVLNYGRDLYCKGDPNIIKYTGQKRGKIASRQLLSGEGYTEAIQYWICLNRYHKFTRRTLQNEIWDGDRFKELSWFWNPEARWAILALCPNCKFEHKPKVTSGDPRNIALIGHWDGWQPFSTSCKHSCGAIEVSIATMKKPDRCCTEEVYVSGIVPSYLLPNKCPISLDQFLEILVEELEDLFVNGIEAEYAGSSEGIPSGKLVIRCILILWTRDYPAQVQVVGKFNSALQTLQCCWYPRFRVNPLLLWFTTDITADTQVMKET
eukprot:Em0107g9a